MALNIVEATKFAEDERGKTVEAIDASSIVTQQKISVGSAALAFNSRTKVLRLHAEEATRIEWGASPSATANSAFRMPANSTEYVSITIDASNSSGFKLDTAAG